MWRRKNKYKQKYLIADITPEDVFIQGENVSNLDTSQMEGRFETPLKIKTILIVATLFFLVALVFVAQSFNLQIKQYEKYFTISENNRLDYSLIFAERGLIYDRNGELLAWNQLDENSDFPLRHYSDTPGINHLLGFVKYPLKDKSGIYYKDDYTGIQGVESFFNTSLAGKNGRQVLEVNASNQVTAANMIVPPEAGDGIHLSIDVRLQEYLFHIIKNLALDYDFDGGGAGIMDIRTGEMLALVSFPEYSSNVMTEGKDVEQIEKYYNNKNKPFLNRMIDGLYTPGSIVKPFLAIGALEEKIISPTKLICESGYLSIPNPYNPDQPTIFRDWRAHGCVDMLKAIAVSGDVYFYQIGGGYLDQQKGMGVYNIKKYLEAFGFTKPFASDSFFFTNNLGVIPTPEWKEVAFPNDPVWRLGDTYNMSIGQYGTMIGPMQALRATAALANGGQLIEPTILKSDASVSFTEVIFSEDKFQIARDGMRMAVSQGSVSGLNTPNIKVAAKTGTAELGVRKDFVNAWVEGFFPFDNPHYAFVVIMERGPEKNNIGGTYVMRTMLDWMASNTPEYFE